jgi:hypothetical protein
VAVLLGLVCAAYAMTWPLALAAAIALTIVATSLVACTLVDTGAKFVSRCFAYGALSGLVVTAALGVTMVLPSFGALLIGGLAVTHPVVRRQVSSWLRSQRPMPKPLADSDGTSSYSSGAPSASTKEMVLGDEPTSLEPLSLATLNGMPDDALCLAWRHSFVALQGATTPRERAQLVLARQGYLDELTRRHPDGMTKWLASGPRAAGNPMPFLTCKG